MPVQIEYFHNKRVMLLTYSEKVLVADVVAVMQQYAQISNEVSGPVHTISDATRIEKLPPNILGLLQSSISPFRNPSRGIFIIVTKNGFIRSIVGLVSRLIGTEFYFVKTLDEAWQMMN